MKFMKYILVSLVIMTSPVFAATGSEQMMLDMIEWIEDNSKYQYNGEPLPVLQVKTQKEVCEALYAEPPAECTAIGYYNNTMNVIVMSPDPIGDMVQEKLIEMIIFHELVHYLQYLNGEDQEVACMNALEKDAYKLQDQYIQEMNWPEENRPNMLFAYLISSCHPDFLGGFQ